MSGRFMTTVAEELLLLFLEEVEDEAEQARLRAEEEERLWREEYEREMEIERELVKYLKELWEEGTPEAWNEYRDVYKDVYGIRPHGQEGHFFGNED